MRFPVREIKYGCEISNFMLSKVVSLNLGHATILEPDINLLQEKSHL